MTEGELWRGWRWFRWRGLALLVVVATGVVAFSVGVGTSDRAAIPESDFMTRVYYTLGLFVLGGLDLGVPSGGPAWGRLLLWCAYFAAPAITTTAVIEAVVRIVGTQRFRLRALRSHTVLAGCGRLALLYLERLRKADPRHSVVVVEKRSDNANLAAAADRYHAHILYGDICSTAVLASLRLQHARRVVLLTGDDFVNLDAASRIARSAPHLAAETIVHVGDLRLLRVLEGSGILSRAARFNAYRSAARHLVEDRLLPHFKSTQPTDTVVLAGFGRFGQSVLDQLQQRAAGMFSIVLIVDLEAELRTQVFAEQVGFDEGYRRFALDADLRHPRTWNRIEEMMETSEPVIVLGSGIDALNVRTAFRLGSRFPAARIVARCFHRSSFTEEISEECNFDVVSTADLLLESMRPEWFE